MDKTEPDYQMIAQYIESTSLGHKLNIMNAYRLLKHGDQDNFNPEGV